MLRVLLALSLIFVLLSSGAAQSTVVLPPPPQYGAYHWNPDDRFWPGYPDRLNWGAEYVSRLGVKVIRVECGCDASNSYGSDPAFVPGQTDYLRTIAQTPQYAALFNNPQFTTYILTTYTCQAYNRLWGTSGADLVTERLEYHNLAVYLAATYPSKRFIISNWEGDNDLYPFRSRAVDYLVLTAQRVIGIRQAATANVFSAVEVNCARDGQGGICDQALVVRMLPALQPDYISYSSWVTLNEIFLSLDQWILRQRFEADIAQIAQTAGPPYSSASVIIGEYGRQAAQPISAATFFTALDRAMRNLQTPYAVLWQALEDKPEVTLGYGAFDPYGNQTENGLAFFRTVLPPVIPPPKKGWPPVW